MGIKTRAAGPSRRWHVPEWDADGRHWTACVRYRVTDRERAAGIEPVVYGPTWGACLAETSRMDHAWTAYPGKHGDPDGTRRRLAFMAGGAA